MMNPENHPRSYHEETLERIYDSFYPANHSLEQWNVGWKFVWRFNNSITLSSRLQASFEERKWVELAASKDALNPPRYFQTIATLVLQNQQWLPPDKSQQWSKTKSRRISCLWFRNEINQKRIAEVSENHNFHLPSVSRDRIKQGQYNWPTLVDHKIQPTRRLLYTWCILLAVKLYMEYWISASNVQMRNPFSHINFDSN